MNKAYDHLILGEKDFLKTSIEKLGGTIHFGRVLMKPGKPTTFATVNIKEHKCFVFSLPGNSVSCFVTFHLFALPAIRKMEGQKNTTLPIIKARLGFDVCISNINISVDFHLIIFFFLTSRHSWTRDQNTIGVSSIGQNQLVCENCYFRSNFPCSSL